MRFFTSLVAIASVLGSVFSAPTSLLDVQVAQGGSTGKHIIKFKDAAASRKWAKKLERYSDYQSFSSFDSVAVKLDAETLYELRAAGEDVEFIQEDGYMYASDIEFEPRAVKTATNAPWGLQRITQAGKLSRTSVTSLDYTFTHDDAAGSGVDVYVVDTGVLVTHSDFGGRARFGFKATSSWSSTDANGHGTHCAGTIAGSRWGVAKAANIIAVKVLGDDGSGTNAGVISGLNWVRTQAASSGRPSVVSMSLGGGAATAVDTAVNNLINAGVHVVVAAGNESQDANNVSPARVANAITVAASTINDALASYSNYGSRIDIIAPGSDITSAWIGSTTATRRISGTSMATPHVAGVVAALISSTGNSTPATITSRLKAKAVTGAITGLRTGTTNTFLQL